jgi:hypothetical protein
MLLSNFSAACRDTGGIKADGKAGHYTLANYPAQGSYYTYTSGGWYVDVGFGDTAVDVDDYKLDDSNSMDNNNLLTFVTTVLYTGSPYVKWVSSYYKNETNSAVTVKEIGMFVKQNGVSTGSGKQYNFMIARKILDTPITLQPGEVKSFSYGIDIAN